LQAYPAVSAFVRLVDESTLSISLLSNPHPDFKKVEGSRPEFAGNDVWAWSKTKDPSWKPGQGGNDSGASLKVNHREIDPYAEGRPGTSTRIRPVGRENADRSSKAVFNYKLLISAIGKDNIYHVTATAHHVF
jgi:hypothetical protein